MSADQITPERIAELRRWTDAHQHLSPSECREVMDALTASRAEVQRLTEEARRSDAGQVEVQIEIPDPPALGGLCGDPLSFIKGVAWARKNARLSPSPQPATGAVVEGGEYLSIHRNALNSVCDEIRQIGDDAHNASTGPAVPDLLWDIRDRSYAAYLSLSDAASEIVQSYNADHITPSLQPSADVVVVPWSAAELARVRRALEGVEPYLEEDPDDDGDYNERVREVRAALAQPQDGTA